MTPSPLKTRFDLLLEKAGFKEDDFKGNVYTEYGNKLEPKIRDYINDEVRKGCPPLLEGKHTREAEVYEPIGYRIHTDGECLEWNQVLEIKTTSQIHEKVEDYKIYLVQLLFYMMFLGCDKGALAVYERPEDFNEEFDVNRLHLYEIDINDYGALTIEIKRALNRFLEDLVEVKENPFISESELIPVEVADIATEIVNFEAQLARMKELEKRIKEDKARLYEAMAAVSVKSWKTPEGFRITLVEGTEEEIKKETYLNEEALKAKHPRIYKQYLEEREVIKKGRAGYVKITAPKSKEG
jgi:hypothetical protein